MAVVPRGGGSGAVEHVAELDLPGDGVPGHELAGEDEIPELGAVAPLLAVPARQVGVPRVGVQQPRAVQREVHALPTPETPDSAQVIQLLHCI